MITIKITTPRDYWKRLQEWVKEPRQNECKAIVDYHHSLIENALSKNEVLDYLSNEDKEHVIRDIIAISSECKKSVNDLIESCYPKFNLPK